MIVRRPECSKTKHRPLRENSMKERLNNACAVFTTKCFVVLLYKHVLVGAGQLIEHIAKVTIVHGLQVLEKFVGIVRFGILQVIRRSPSDLVKFIPCINERGRVVAVHFNGYDPHRSRQRHGCPDRLGQYLSCHWLFTTVDIVQGCYVQ